jgi:hypothetical protein
MKKVTGAASTILPQLIADLVNGGQDFHPRLVSSGAPKWLGS